MGKKEKKDKALANDPGIKELIAKHLNEAGGKPALKAATLCALCIFLFSIQSALPADWKVYFQWPIYIAFLLGLGRLSFSLLV